MGERTLLIDADMRAPRQHELFVLENKQGLSTVLSGRASSDCIVKIPLFDKLSVLPSGPLPPNPQELLNRPSFGELLAKASGQFDVVLIDTAAYATGSDASLAAMRAGAALAIARQHETRLAALEGFVNTLVHSGVAVVGTVLNSPPLVQSSHA